MLIKADSMNESALLQRRPIRSGVRRHPLVRNQKMDEFHIFSSAYFRAAVNRSQYVNDGRKEIAFIGRSNVGKSSLINSLCGRKKLAFVSREPGKTRTINYYAIQSRRMEEEKEVRQDWYLVDLPGYGLPKQASRTRTAGHPSLQTTWNIRLPCR